MVQVHRPTKGEPSMFKIAAVVLIILALIVILVPQFTNCAAAGKVLTLQNGKTVAMKCAWSARAELALGIPLLAIGVLLAVSRRKETIRSLSILGAIEGVLVILIPTTLIGVCASAAMDCNSVLKPTMIVCGVLTVLVSLAALVLNERRTENPA
jgi:uncharacterized membrane protein HdeD (DUF308 family)